MALEHVSGGTCGTWPELRQSWSRGAVMVNTPVLDREELSLSILTPAGIVNFCSNSLQAPLDSCLADIVRTFPSVLTYSS